MQFASVFATIVAFAVVATAVAVPAHVIDSSVGAGSVDVANVGGGNAQGSNLAGSNLGAVVVGAAANKGLPVRRRKTASQPEYINSPQTSTENSCTVGQAQCCQSLHQTQDLASQGFLGQLLTADIPLNDLMVGVQCTPLAGVVPIVGGSSSCSSQPVCCSSNKYGGLVSMGCSPLSLN